MIGEIIKERGDGRYDIKCEDGTNRIALARGTIRRRLMIKLGDTVEVTLREFEPVKCDIFKKL